MANQEKSRKNVEVVSDMLNCFGFDVEGFCQFMCRQHRTLQQSFTRLCIHWLKTCADADYHYDGRNAASHEVAVEISISYGTYHPGKSFEDIELPFI